MSNTRERCRRFLDRVFERGLTDNQRRRLAANLERYAAERHAPAMQCAYPGGYPKKTSRPQRKDAKDRDRGAATAASHRVADDE